MHIGFRVRISREARDKIERFKNVVEAATVVAILVLVVRAL